jgi:serine/threonine protein kinase
VQALTTATCTGPTSTCRLRLPHAKFYAANVLSVLSYMNESGILYRDLKPENLVLDAMGYLKLVDFGLAKKIMPSERTYTMCGTPDYLAPELISGGGYGRSCDLWSFGILLFELVTRRTPFFDENQSQMMNKIINSDQFLSGAFPKSLDSSLKELIKRLLDPNPAMRMGNLEHGVDDIWEHPWFIELRRENIEQRALNAPFAPPVSKGSRSDRNVDAVVAIPTSIAFSLQVLQESSNELRADPVPLSSGSAHFFSGFDMDLKPPTYPDE